MIPVYEAIDIVNFIDEASGHTKPWVVIANTPSGLKSFVVKLYSTEQVDTFNCVSNEVICSILASEFDLPTPNIALINIPDEITLNLPPDKQQQFYNTDPRPKFATELIGNVNSAIFNLPKKYFEKRIPIDMLYAFDNLIRNGDRGHPKTNLLLAPDKAYLIDHELTFRSQDIVNINLDFLQLESKFTKSHLVYPFLKKSKFNTKLDYFHEFFEIMRYLNINSLDSYYTALANEGFNNNSAEIYYWLREVKQKIHKFVDLLRGSIQ